jgi:hypothetical protein
VNKAFGLREYLDSIPLPYWMGVAFDLKHQRFRRNQLSLSGLAQGNNTQNSFSFDGDPKLGLRVKWPLQAAHVEVDLHVENIPGGFENSSEPGEGRLIGAR